jgi:hypothetical protein
MGNCLNQQLGIDLVEVVQNSRDAESKDFFDISLDFGASCKEVHWDDWKHQAHLKDYKDLNDLISTLTLTESRSEVIKVSIIDSFTVSYNCK